MASSHPCPAAWRIEAKAGARRRCHGLTRRLAAALPAVLLLAGCTTLGPDFAPPNTDWAEVERIYIGYRTTEVQLRITRSNALLQRRSVEIAETRFRNGADDELGVLPGRVIRGKLRSIGYGVSSGAKTSPDGLPDVQSSRDWLRQAQRFPVLIEFDDGELGGVPGVREGGQAEALVYTGDNPLPNFLGGCLSAG
jgi:hypothetical protein